MIRKIVKKVIPKSVVEIYKLFIGTRPLLERDCPLCGYRGKFYPHGKPSRIDARCKSCGSLERHRLFWLWFDKNKDSIKSPILHFAPEPILESRIRNEFPEYKTADLFRKADIKINIEAIDLPSDSIGTIICNHVLEHVDDLLAIKELYRVLIPGGALLVSVPLVDGWDKTYEDSAINTPALRDAHFGQYDHIRYYGRDFRTRLSDAGFQIKEFTAFGEDVVKYSLSRGGKQFICTK